MSDHVLSYEKLPAVEIRELWPAYDAHADGDLPNAWRVVCQCGWRSKATIGKSGLGTIGQVHRLATRDEVLP
jgi:hypothetical protein